MKPLYSKEQLESYFASFERMGGENPVRAAIESGIWKDTDRLRHGAAKVYIQQIEEAKQKIPKIKPWHEKAWGKILIAIIGGLIVFGITLYIRAYLIATK